MAKKAAKPLRKPEPEIPVDVPMAELVVTKQYGARPSLAKPCPFCKHHYLKPCTDKTKDTCPNYKHLKGKK